MILPSNGSVVIIDDQASQAMPILKALSKKGISTTWYQGTDEEDFPNEPAQTIRLAIVDLQLIQGDNDGHTIATRLVNILKKIIAPNNGPYMLLIWSLKEALYGKDLIAEINREQNGIIPACIISLDKTKCIRRKEELGAKELIPLVLNELKAGFDPNDLNAIKLSIENNWIVDENSEYEILPDAVQIIEKAISEQLKEAGVFHLFVIWENLIKKSAAKTVAEVANTLDLGEHWEPNMRDVFRRMGIARIGKNEVNDETLIKESVMTFIQSFTDNFETSIKKEQLPDYISLGGNELIQLKLVTGEYRLVKTENSYDIVRGETLIVQGGNFNKLNKSIDKIPEQPIKDDCNTLLYKYMSIPPRLNNSIHLEIDPANDHIPGNIFEIKFSSREKKIEYLRTYFRNLDDIYVDQVQFVELEVSPICDYAQKKWKKSRLVSGIIFPAELLTEARDHFYQVEPVFYLNSMDSKLAFDCHLLKSLDLDIVESRTPKYRLKRELLLDIIAKVSSHVNRPGISFIQ